MAEKKCPFCGDVFFVKNSARTCSRKCGYALRSKEQTKWTQEKIIKQIQRLHDLGIPLNSRLLKKSKYSPVVVATQKYFGGWKKAVKAAGFTPLRKSWSKQEILKQVRTWHNNNQKLNYYTIKNLDANFTSAVSCYSKNPGKTSTK